MRKARDRDDLPIKDYDHLPTGTLVHRIRSLTADQVDTLIRHEEAHGRRTVVLQVLRSRANALAGGAEPSGGTVSGERRPGSEGAAGTGPVSPDTAGPETVQPAHGDPTNPVPGTRNP